MGIRIPTVLDAILEATAIEQAAKARITGLRKVLEDEARRRYLEEGAAPTWKARGAGAVRFDAPGEWEATVADPDTFGSYVAERHPAEASAVITIPAADLDDALTALKFVGIDHQGARIEVAPKFTAGYLERLIVDVEETHGDDGTIDRVVTIVDPDTGQLVDGVSAHRSNANGKLVVTLDRDRRQAALAAAKADAEAIVAEATGQPAPAPIEPGREVTLDELTAAGVVRPASELSPAERATVERFESAPDPFELVEDEDGAPLPPAQQTPEANGHRLPYVGDGADGARRSAEIDRTEAEGYDRDDPRRDAALASAERWEAQAAELEAAATEAEEPTRIPVDDRDHFTGAERGSVDYLNGKRAEALEAAANRETLRRIARAKGINPGGTKADVAVRLAAAGVTAEDLTA